MSKKILFFFFICSSFLLNAQYTTLINSNRPGFSESPYSVGTSIYQIETGVFYNSSKIVRFFTIPKSFGYELTFRTSFFDEKFENTTLEPRYIKQDKVTEEVYSTESYILEMGFEGLNGVDFRKGCYVGQEVTARMKHKTELRKGLVRLVADAEIPENADVVSNGKVIGRTHTSAGKRALAYLRYDRVDGDISVNDIPVTWQK